MAQRLILFNPQDLLQLWCHYTDGAEIPLDVKVESVEVSKFLQRWIGFTAVSDHWPTEGLGNTAMRMVQLRYAGNHVMKISEKGIESDWEKAPEAPKRQ